MSAWTRRIAAVMAAGLAASAFAAVQSVASAAPLTDPASVRCEGVAYAKPLATDRKNGVPVVPVPDPRGQYIPIVIVHGWTGRSTHTDERDGAFSHLIDLTTIYGNKTEAARSLIGQLQVIPGAAVYTFDYHEHSARWVTDEHLGPALGKAVDCLHQASGEKVIIVAHSMGGLVARWAVTADGGQRAQRVSTVVTFGTPQTGSQVADTIADEVNQSNSLPAAVIRLLLAECGKRSSEKLDTGSVCDLLPAAARAFDSEAGRALRSGSTELKNVPAFPPDVQLVALAGNTTLQTSDLGWFGAKPRKEEDIPVGDLIVTVDSATHQAVEKYDADCFYQLRVSASANDQIAVTFRQKAQSDVPRPIWTVMGPCFHSNLMRTVELTNKAAGAIADDIQVRSAAFVQNFPKPYVGSWVYQCGDADVTLVIRPDLTGTYTSVVYLYEPENRYVTRKTDVRFVVEGGKLFELSGNKRSRVSLTEGGNVISFTQDNGQPGGQLWKSTWDDYLC